jgi:hypothetical protein
VVGGALGYFAQPLIPGAKFIGAELAGSSVINGAIAGAGIGTAWGMADAGSGKTGWDNIWKYGITGGLAGATIGFGAQTGMFSPTPQGFSWSGLRNATIFWSGAFASANSMESVKGSAGKYWKSIGNGLGYGAAYGGGSYLWVAGTDTYAGMFAKDLGATEEAARLAGAHFRYHFNMFVGLTSQYRSMVSGEEGVDHGLVGFGLGFLNFPLLQNLRNHGLPIPFLEQASSFAVLDDFLQTHISLLGHGGHGSPLNAWYRKKFLKHRPWLNIF